MTQTSSAPVNSKPTALPVQAQPVKTTPSTLQTPSVMQTVPTSTDLLSEVSGMLADMKEHLDGLQSRLVKVGRKLRKAISMQRQKEHSYQETQKLIERIRKAG